MGELELCLNYNHIPSSSFLDQYNYRRDKGAHDPGGVTDAWSRITFSFCTIFEQKKEENPVENKFFDF